MRVRKQLQASSQISRPALMLTLSRLNKGWLYYVIFKMRVERFLSAIFLITLTST